MNGKPFGAPAFASMLPALFSVKMFQKWPYPSDVENESEHKVIFLASCWRRVGNRAAAEEEEDQTGQSEERQSWTVHWYSVRKEVRA